MKYAMPKQITKSAYSNDLIESRGDADTGSSESFGNMSASVGDGFSLEISQIDLSEHDCVSNTRARVVNDNRNDNNHLSGSADESDDSETSPLSIVNNLNSLNRNESEESFQSAITENDISSSNNDNQRNNILNHARFFRINRGQYDCLVLWSRVVNKTNKMWDLLSLVLNDFQIQCVQKVVRCRKYVRRDINRHKFELFCTKGYGMQIKHMLQMKTSRHYGLFVKNWLPYHLRNNSGPAASKVNDNGSDLTFKLAVMSWNVNRAVSVDRKMILKFNINRFKQDVVMIQESGLKSDSEAMFVPGYHSIDNSECGNSDKRNLVMLIKNKISHDWYYVGKANEHMMAMRFVHKELAKVTQPTGVILVNVYIPTHYELKKQMLKALTQLLSSLARQFPRDTCLVGGDFNDKNRNMKKLVDEWSRIFGEATLVGKENFPWTWFGKRCNRLSKSELDYFVLLSFGDQAHETSVTKTRVLYNDLSDHSPIQTLMSQTVPAHARMGEAGNDTESDDDLNKCLDIGLIDPQNQADQRRLFVNVTNIIDDKLNALNQFKLLAGSGSKVSFDRKECLKKASLINNDKSWLEVVDEIEKDDIDIDLITNKFINICAVVAKKHKLAKDLSNAKAFTNYRIPKQMVNAIEYRKKCYLDYCQLMINYQEYISNAENQSVSQQELIEWKEAINEKDKLWKGAKDICKSMARAERNKRYKKWVEKSIEYISNNDSREYWRWIKTFVPLINRNRKQNVARMPVKHPDNGELVNDSKGIVLANALHYGRLASDITGHSKDRIYWKNVFGDDIELSRIDNAKKRMKKFGIKKVKGRVQRDELEELAKDITIEECLTAIKAFKNNKAVGVDSIPAEFLKACLDSNNSNSNINIVDDNHEEMNVGSGRLSDSGSHQQENVSLSPLTKTIYLLIKKVFICDSLPEAWSYATIVSIPKPHADDPQKLTNQRGISLMSVVLKILAKIVAKRLLDYCEACKLLIPEQVGFRSREEAVAQAAALVEICQRRSIVERQTWLTFIDLKKAYDTVPHEALFHKLEQKFGIPGDHPMTKFLRVLYENSAINFDDKENGKRYSINLNRGLRQGCPISPILFNMFINDIADESLAWALRVPQTPASKRIGLLLFADDLVLMTKNKTKMEKAVRSVEQWCRRNEMSVGIGKCGSMVINDQNNELQQSSFHINGEKIPQVDEYIYLGVKITNDISLQAMFDFRYEIFRKRYGAIAKQLSNYSIPLRSRILIVKSMLLPSLLYGAEVYGMSAARVVKGETIMKRICKRLIGLKPYSRVLNYEVALMELTLLPIHVEASARRARLFNKPHFRTWIQTLKMNTFSSRKWVWSNGSQRWIKGRAPEFVSVTSNMNYVKRLWFAQLCLKKANSNSRTLAIYQAHTNQNSAKQWILDQSKEIELANTYAFGFSLLLRARTRTFGTTRQWAQWRILSPYFLTHCAMCGSTGNIGYGECLTHMLLECKRFAMMRKYVLKDLIETLRVKLYDSHGNVKFPDYPVSEFPVNALSSRPNEGLIDERYLTSNWCASSLRRARILLLGGSIPELDSGNRNNVVFNDRVLVAKKVSQFLGAIWSVRVERLKIVRNSSQMVEASDSNSSPERSSEEISSGQ